jgi:Golgi nucleoside diphosphatase
MTSLATSVVLLWTAVVAAMLVSVCVFPSSVLLVRAATEEDPNDLDIRVATVNGIIIDAGSGGSRLHVFNWAPRIFKTLPPGITFPTANEAWTARMAPGVSTLTTFDQVKMHLAPLLDFAVATLIDVETDYGDIPIFFKATGGMRELPLDERETIMGYVRTLLADKTFSPFFFHYEMARVISGEEEAIFSWACVNYLFGTLLPPNGGTYTPNSGTTVSSRINGNNVYGPVIPLNQTFGTVDLGGASTQIAFFVESQDISEGLFKLQLGSSRHWNVYTKSFLQFGHQSARVRHVTSLALQSISDANHSHCKDSSKCANSNAGANGMALAAKNLTAVDDCFFSGYSEVVTPTEISSEEYPVADPQGLPFVKLVGPSQPHADQFERCKTAARPLLLKYANSYCDVVYNGQCSINGTSSSIRLSVQCRNRF